MDREVFALVVLFVMGAAALIGYRLRIADIQRQIDDLQARVSCLEDPHGESSIAGRFVGTGSHRRFVVTQPAHRTGCTP